MKSSKIDETCYLTHSHSESHSKVSSATLILLKITWELSETLQNIWTRVIVWLLINIAPSNVFQKMLLQVEYLKNR